MSTGYAIVRLDRRADETSVKILELVWSEAEAVEIVDRLNALDSSGGPPAHSWQRTWVARLQEGPTPLTLEDGLKLDLARIRGLIDTERGVRVFFTFMFNRAGCRAACEELRSLGWHGVDMDEEITGDDLWHIWTRGRPLVLNAAAIVAVRGQMEDLAERHGGEFDGWELDGADRLELRRIAGS